MTRGDAVVVCVIACEPLAECPSVDVWADAEEVVGMSCCGGGLSTCCTEVDDSSCELFDDVDDWEVDESDCGRRRSGFDLSTGPRLDLYLQKNKSISLAVVFFWDTAL